MNAELMKQYGIDIEAGTTRFLGNADLYKRILTMFMKDDTFTRTQTAYLENDRDALMKCAHELKGVSGNAALTDLYDSSSALVEYLRNGGEDSAEINELFGTLGEAYVRAKEGINLALND